MALCYVFQFCANMRASRGARQAPKEEKKEKKGTENAKGDAKKEGGKKVCLAAPLLRMCLLLW